MEREILQTETDIMTGKEGTVQCAVQNCRMTMGGVAVICNSQVNSRAGRLYSGFLAGKTLLNKSLCTSVCLSPRSWKIP